MFFFNYIEILLPGSLETYNVVLCKEIYQLHGSFKTEIFVRSLSTEQYLVHTRQKPVLNNLLFIFPEMELFSIFL